MLSSELENREKRNIIEALFWLIWFIIKKKADG